MSAPNGALWLYRSGHGAATPADCAPARARSNLAFSGGLSHKAALIPPSAWAKHMTDFAHARRMMVDGQIRTNDVTDLRLLAA
ncbi:MAG TPA: hypothetical protein VG100_05640, partial [Xanthobacteraceae bacterium]|nr:hypothetical protein [Xanthobacteraceae bacterium]